jgi:hypothetical protein
MYASYSAGGGSETRIFVPYTLKQTNREKRQNERSALSVVLIPHMETYRKPDVSCDYSFGLRDLNFGIFLKDPIHETW